MNMIKDFLHQYKHELPIYITSGAMILAAYLIIAKLLPIIMTYRVIID